MAVRLEGQGGPYELPNGETIIGRGRDCGLRINDPRLSRHHARFLVDGSNVVVQDLGSTNGVLVNGKRLVKRKSIAHDDIVVIGPCVLTTVIDATLPQVSRHTATEVDGAAESEPRSDTEAMDPVDDTEAEAAAVTPPSDQRPRSRMHPSIAQAVHQGAGPKPSQTEDTLLPHEFEADQPSVLTNDRDAAKPAMPRAPENTTTLLPDQYEPGTGRALHSQRERKREERQAARAAKRQKRAARAAEPQPEPTSRAHETIVAAAKAQRRPRGYLGLRRLAAGSLDLLSILIVGSALFALPLLFGYAWGLSAGGFRLTAAGPSLQEAGERLTMLAWLIECALSPVATLSQAGEIIADDMYRNLDRSQGMRGPFRSVWIGGSIGLLAAAAAVLWMSVAATVMRGGPYWHRRFGLAVVEQPGGYYPRWWASCLRWALLLLTLPAAPFTALRDRRGLHDLASHCELQRRH